MMWAWVENESTTPCVPLAIPRPGTVIEVYAQLYLPGNEIGSALILYENGDLYRYRRSGGWTLKANITGDQPVITTPSTWGRIKADRR